ncbi:hypothetical protein BV25DRAFT_1783282, partial [Artomyces pyxidatus]
SWIPFRQDYLEEVLRLDGRGLFAAATGCPRCGSDESPTIRCRDCVGQELLCLSCAVKGHSRNPLHMVERWTGSFFERVLLAQLGLTIQLNHPPGKACSYPLAGHKDFVVIHTNGIHTVSLDFCGCNAAEGIERRQQLLRTGWWPATPLNPQTAATFQCMDTFHLLSLQGKVTGYDFYKSLQLRTDNSGLTEVPDRLASFMMMARQWRHIMMMKRAGRGHDPEGIEGTKPGECAVMCPACPHPGINLPEDWEAAPKDRSWLYRLVLAMDANFRLKNRLRSSRAKDPGLNTGMAYFVGDDGYSEHLEKYFDQDQMSGCSRFAAVAAANLKGSKGLRVTGVGGIFCARHELWRPNGLGDLQKGERRYCNMDYVFLSSLVNVANKALLVSYDIACQWSKNLLSRARNLHFQLPGVIDFVVPKFHLPAHKQDCHAPYGLHYKFGAGQTDGEAPERNWADMNGAAASTKEMGPGARHDTLDDHCGHSNWRKFVRIVALLRRRLAVAVLEARDHSDVYTDFTAALKSDHPETMQEWEEEILAWERNETGRRNPYQKPPECEFPLSTHVSMILTSAFIILYARPFLLIRYCRLKLRLEAHGDRTTHQAAQVQESRTAILRLVRRLRGEQEFHMPRIASIIASDESASSHTTQRPELIKLYFPSDFPTDERHEFCEPTLSTMESKLRYAAMSEALDDLRHQLRFRTYMNNWKIKNVKGQRPNTRARGTQTSIEVCIKRAVETYRLHRKAYFSLVGDGPWQDKFRVLADQDIRGLGERLIDGMNAAAEERVREFVRSRNGGTASGESRYVLPWIWYSAGKDLNSEDLEMGDGELIAAFSDYLKLEWFKTRARSKRWMEEVVFLCEEMRRVTVTCTWKADWWRARGAFRDVSSAELEEGLRAYSAKQAHLFQNIAIRSTLEWAQIQGTAEEFL